MSCDDLCPLRGLLSEGEDAFRFLNTCRMADHFISGGERQGPERTVSLEPPRAPPSGSTSSEGTTTVLTEAFDDLRTCPSRPLQVVAESRDQYFSASGSSNAA